LFCVHGFSFVDFRLVELPILSTLGKPPIEALQVCFRPARRGINNLQKEKIMDNDELMRIRGEQVTLECERREKVSQFDTETAALQAFVNGLRSQRTAKKDWLFEETARLKRIAELQTAIAELDERIAQLKRVSGI
jgi:hypothetical protein